MSRRFEDTLRQSESELPRLVVTALGFLLASTGVWLWWFGEDTSSRIVRADDINDPLAPLIWMRRLHAFAGYALAVVLVVLILRSVVLRRNWQTVFFAAALLFVAVGISAGLTADWDAARIWSENVGGKLAAGVNLGDGPSLPDGLQPVRVHLAIVPAALLAVIIMSFLRSER